MSGRPRTAKEVREALQGSRRAYIRPVFTAALLRIFDARERKGETQVKCGMDARWHTVRIGDEIWSTES